MSWISCGGRRGPIAVQRKGCLSRMSCNGESLRLRSLSTRLQAVSPRLSPLPMLLRLRPRARQRGLQVATEARVALAGRRGFGQQERCGSRRTGNDNNNNNKEYPGNFARTDNNNINNHDIVLQYSRVIALRPPPPRISDLRIPKSLCDLESDLAQVLSDAHLVFSDDAPAVRRSRSTPPRAKGKTPLVPPQAAQRPTKRDAPRTSSAAPARNRGVKRMRQSSPPPRRK